MNKYLIILFVLISSVSFSQTDYYTFTHKDGWLQPESGATSKEFIKIKIGEQGIYRLGYTELLSQGFSFANENQIKLYRRGIEQAIYIEGNGDGLNSSNDYIEFYGDKNDGQLDEELYFPKSIHPHNYFSLFSDTASYFLTSKESSNGKRVANFSSNSTSTEPFYIEEKLKLYTDEYNDGYNLGAGIRTPFYDRAEGWFSVGKTMSQSPIVTTFNQVDNISSTSDPNYSPNLELVIVGSNSNPQYFNIEISKDGSTYSSVHSDTIFGFNSKKINVPLTFTDINGSGNFYVRINITNADSRIKIGYVKLRFAREFNFSTNDGNIELKIKNSNQLSTLNLTSISANNLIYMVDEFGNNLRSKNQSNINVLHSSSVPKLYFTAESNVKTIQLNQLEKVEVRLPNTTSEYIIISPKYLSSSAQNYKNYRASLDGGGYESEVFDVENLYNVFSYGDYSPIAIRRFCDYLISNGNNAKYLLLLGKGLDVNNKENGLGYFRFNQSDYSFSRGGVTLRNFNTVPPVGTPGSDIFYSSHIISSNTWVPEISTGRISAISNEELEGYLDKVIEYEASEDDIWKKRILHLGGGNDETQINRFKGHLKGWEEIAKGEYFGGQVSGIYKSTTDEVQNLSVEDEVNEGVRLITFFGHSSANQSQIDIGRASDISKGYENDNGKYPVILLNGCLSGNFYNNSTGFGEDWIITPNKGAVAFISSSTTAYESYLESYTDKFYNIAFEDTSFLSSTIGDIVKEVNRKLNYTGNASSTALAHSMNINILGDPALPMFNKKLPDLETNNGAVFLQPIDEEVVTAVSDTFNVGIVVRNFGKYSMSDSFYVSIERTYNGVTVNYPPKMYNAVASFDTIYFGISSSNIQTYGLNNFKINIDYNSNISGVEKGAIDEDKEDNNEAIFQQVIPLSGVIPIFPREFGIIGLSQQNEYNQPWILTAQSTNLMVEPRDYIFQLDTSKLFNGGFLKQKIINGGSVVSWDATQELNSMLLSLSNTQGGNPDSVIFYWRVKYNDLLPGEDDLWGYSSFMYNYQSPGGWAQGHYYQFLQDKFEYLKINPNNRKWEFTNISTKIRYSTTGPKGITSNENPQLPKLTQDNLEPGYIYTNSSTNERGRGLLVNVYDDIELKQINNLPGGAGVRAAGMYYYFRMMDNSPNNIDDFVSFIQSIPNGKYVAILTKDSTNYSDWPQLNAAFTSIGAQVFPPPDTVGYAIMGRKNGAALFEKYIYGSNNFDTIVELKSFLNFGSNESTVIGPSTKWNTMYRHVKNENVDDNWSIDIYGLDATQNNDSLLAQNVKLDNYNLDFIDHDIYPYLKLVIKKEDLVNRTPPQLKNWVVSFESKIPEGIIVASNDVEDYSEQEFYEGEKVNYKFRFKNISKYDFKDSLVVKGVLISEASSLNPFEFKISKPAPNEYTDFTYEFETRNLDGDYLLQLTVNPSIEIEQYYHNNSISIPFKIYADDIHPILDVTFDGTHIMDYDIVSPKTSIKIRMKDENKFLFKQDKEGLMMQIQHPEPTNYLQTVNLYDLPEGNFTPADEKHDLEIIYNKEEPFPDGEYELIVQVEDEVGNKSGTREYRIHFTVVNETSMTHFIPYPNPFSTSMRFAYTLTGSEQPDRLKIQIMTISGKIVREISQFELGPLKIGKHLTDFVWDGTDEFGSKLANGVYLYRVIADVKNDKGNYEKIKSRNAGSLYEYNSIRDSDGKEVDKEYYGESKTDELFKKGWGKIYIMR